MALTPNEFPRALKNDPSACAFCLSLACCRFSSVTAAPPSYLCLTAISGGGGGEGLSRGGEHEQVRALCSALHFSLRVERENIF